MPPIMLPADVPGIRGPIALRPLVVGLAVFVLATTGALAQDTTGTIEGAVTDRTASPIAGAHVVARNLDTGFTKEDSANVALQANSPPISGFPASRPNLIGDPNGGPHTVDEWISRSAFQRLNVQTQAGQFGNAGRNIARGAGYTNVDVSLVRDFQLPRDTRLQFRAEVFNVSNHVNLGLPVADLNSPNFGRIFSAGPPRLMQFALKLIF